MKEAFLFMLFITMIFIIPVFTFGHCYNNIVFVKELDQKVAACIIPTLGFPFYWSVKLLEKEQPE